VAVRVRICVRRELGLIPRGLGDGPLAVGLGVSGPADLGFQLLGGQVGTALGQRGLLLDDLLGGPRLGQRPRLRGPGLGLLGLGQETRTSELQVAGVLRLHRLRLLLLLGRQLVCPGLRDAGPGWRPRPRAGPRGC
jgi:hypothetical protein